MFLNSGVSRELTIELLKQVYCAIINCQRRLLLNPMARNLKHCFWGLVRACMVLIVMRIWTIDRDCRFWIPDEKNLGCLNLWIIARDHRCLKSVWHPPLSPNSMMEVDVGFSWSRGWIIRKTSLIIFLFGSHSHSHSHNLFEIQTGPNSLYHNIDFN